MAIYMPNDLREIIEEMAQKNHLSRSAVIAAALRKALNVPLRDPGEVVERDL